MPATVRGWQAAGEIAKYITVEQFNSLSGNDRNFLLSLASTLVRYRRLSEKQEYWWNRLLRRATGAEAPEQVDRLDGLGAIVALFDSAADHLKYPKVKFERWQLYRTGERSKEPGSVAITSTHRDREERIFYGRITRGGEFIGTRNTPKELPDFLRSLNEDPAGVAAEYGKRNGACCFCARELTDPVSVEQGYGPVCAKRYDI